MNPFVVVDVGAGDFVSGSEVVPTGQKAAFSSSGVLLACADSRTPHIAMDAMAARVYPSASPLRYPGAVTRSKAAGGPVTAFAETLLGGRSVRRIRVTARATSTSVAVNFDFQAVAS